MKEPSGYHDSPSRVHVLDVRAVARALGGDVVGRHKVAAPGPGHRPQDRSLTITLDASAPDGFVCFSHAGDDWAACKDHVRAHLGLPLWRPGKGRQRRAVPPLRRAFARIHANHQASANGEHAPLISVEQPSNGHTTEAELIRIVRARAIWRAAVEPRGTPAETYLASRALVLSEGLAGTVLRFHPETPWRDQDTGEMITLPALLAAFRSLDDDAIMAVHRIRLDQPERWPKAERRMFGVVQRATVKLGAATETLHIGEGVETCMAAIQLGYAPAWAVGSAGAMADFPLIDGVTCLRILAERCATNARAAERCARRWHAGGRRVQIGLPDDERDKDFNDEVMRGTRRDELCRL